MKIGAALVACSLALAGCASPTPYQPLRPDNDVSGGYSNQRISNDQYRVTFSGNDMTSRQTVENYLLYRAAELTVQQGYDWFAMTDRNTDRKSRTYVDHPFGPGPYGWWGPRWRYHRRGLAWSTWDPFFGDPFWADHVDVHTIDRFEATAEIRMGHGARPADNPRAFDAHEVMQNLGPNIQRPTA